MFDTEVRRKIGGKFMNSFPVDKSRALDRIKNSFIHFGFYLVILGSGIYHLDGPHLEKFFNWKTHFKSNRSYKSYGSNGILTKSEEFSWIVHRTLLGSI